VQSTPCRRLSITLPEDLLHTIQQEAHYRSVSRSAVIAQHLYRALHASKKRMDHKT
jgi:metal-responsive CopG/Arc/MetJ family transcriptional regulator